MHASLFRRLAELEGAESALVLASGRAAVACTVLALLRPGDHLLAVSALCKSTRHFFDHELPALGVDVTFVDPMDTRGWRRGLRRTTRGLYVECPIIRSGRLVDLRPPRALAQELGIALIVDATAASPINFTPMAHGADVVLHDATYLLEPHGEGEAGVVTGTEGVVEEVRLKMETWGAVPNALAYAQLDRGLATLEVRVQRQNASAQSLAEWALHQRDFRAVEWAGLPTYPDRSLVEEWYKGPGSQVHLHLNEGQDAWRVAAHASDHLADTRGGRNVVTRVSEGTEPGWLRVQVGLEPVDTIIEALISALTTTALTSS